SLAAYLDELERKKGEELLSKVINDQFEAARIEINELSEDFRTQVMTDNVAMLEAYDALQVNVANMKTDMLQALNIAVGYVDADGD
ncbi:MAG: peptidase M75 superfamily protein, partial [Bacteroidota bacterium]